MYKHSTTHRTLSRRLAALLAAMALLAALALPVYAETLNGATQMQETVKMDNNGEPDNNGEADNKVETGSDVEPDDKSKTNEGTGAGADTDSEDTKDNASSSTTDDSNTTADDAVNDTPQTPPADNIGTTAGKTTMDDTPDTMDEDEDAKQDSVTQSTDDAATDNEIAAHSVNYPVWVYVAVKDDFQEGWTVKFNSNKAKPKEAENWLEKQLMVEKTPYKGRKVFGFELTQDNCPNNGYSRIQFLPWNSNDQQQNPIYEASNTWKDINEFANKLYDAKTGEWVVDYKPFDPTDHNAFSGKKMAFKNASANALTNVVAHFYEKDADGKLSEVERQNLNNNVPAGEKVDFTIPLNGKPCGFVQFTAGEPEKIISSIYNFYGQKVGTGEESFLYNEETQFCFVYSANNMAHWGTGEGQRTIYYDATFSKLSADTGYAIPSNVGGTVYYYLTGEKGNKAGEMARQTNDLYSVDIEDGYDHIIFGAYKPTSATNVAGRGNSTANLEIPAADKYISPCFYADTGDDSTYGGADWHTDLTRDGYWAEVNTRRNAEANKVGKTVVDVPEAEFKADSSTKYIDTTLYDYYTDWELNGNNRDNYKVNNGASQRNWVTFRQFDQALSDYYQSDTKQTVLYPIYTGHFQPNEIGGELFSNVASALNLYGWDQYNTFMAVNNSYKDIDGKINLANPNNKEDKNNYVFTFQGLVSDTLNKDGNPTLYNTNLAEPHFNKAFLEGDNSKNAVLGKVYENVDFPFTKKDVFSNGVSYWHYESNDKSLFLKQKKETADQYFLQQPATSDAVNKQVSDKAQNVDSSSTPSGTYGFFPFNEGSTNTHANTYNYGFGAKLQFDFTLTDDGQVLDNKGTKVPIQFFFSGDDDVWVYIDNELALDVGGEHGKASGLLEFGPKNVEGKNTYTAYVSKVKAGNKDQSYTSGANKSVNYLGSQISFNYQSEEKTLTPGKHTLRLFYMERGMWESNMAIAFNFPDNNELQVEKKVDLSNVKDPEFAACFTNQKIFNFTIQNQATHYGPKAAVGSGDSGTQSQKVDLTKNVSIAPATPNREDEYIFKLDTNPHPDSKQDTEQVLHWYARYTDTEPVSEKRNKRYGILTLEDPINIKNKRFLTFQVYVDPTDKGGALSLNNLYLELLDDQTPSIQKGSLGTTGINGATYGSVELETGKWVTVKLDLNKMKKQDGFNDNVKTIRVGDNYSRHIYFRNFTFIPKAVPTEMTGFTTDQEKIPDYGSATTGQLKNAENAQYTSNMDTDTQLVDEDGRFVLEDGEIVTFSDQFRRGSYISLKEDLNQNLYDTKWTVYENGQKVKSTKPTNANYTSVKLGGEPKSLESQNFPTEGPDDDRTEVYDNTDGVKNDGYTANSKKPDKNTIVFRSYKDPDETSSTLTKLKVEYVNTVKTGGLKIQKQAAAGEKDTIKGTYKFKVTFNDVGGEGLEEKSIERTVTINMSEGDTGTITGIPVGTRYTIEEETPKDDSRLQSVTVPAGCKSAHVINNNTMVEGVIVESKDPEVTAIFTNTQRTLINIEFDKHWKDANDKNIGTTKQPDEIYIQLQRRLKTDTTDASWKPVRYPADSKKDYVTITRGEDGWQHTFSGLDQYQIHAGDSHTDYVYRIVEGTVKDGSFIPAAADGTITIKGNTYVVTVKAEATPNSETNSAGSSTGNTATVTPDGTITGGSGKIVLTNTLQNPKFNLDILKKSADEPETPLKGVEFKLEKLTADGNAVDEKFTARIGITNAQGEVKVKGPDEHATEKNIFHDLEAGAYRLTETKTAEGYNLLSAPILVTFTKAGTCTLNGSTIEVSTKENKPTEFTKNADGSYTLALTVLNRKTPALPHTGADAPSLWLLIGLPLAVAGLLILVFRYNKKGGRTR